MSPVFSRSLRAIEADRGHPSALGLLGIAALLAAWSSWFLLARVTLYEVTDAVRLEADTVLVADFPPATLGHIQRGQPARLRLDGYPWTQYGTVPATVSRVTVHDRGDAVRVELALHPRPGSAIPLQAGMPGRVEIEVSRVSPATLLLRAVGQRVGR
jgi:multidrug resistance efflux pump